MAGRARRARPAAQGSEIAVTLPDPYGAGAGRHPAAARPWTLPDPPARARRCSAAPAGFTAAPAVPAGYGYGQYPAVAVPPGMYVDQMSGLLLPNGTELASVGRRIGAGFLTIPLAIVTLGIGYIIWGLIVWGNGQTPALQVLGMRSWRPETNRVAGFWYMALREIPGRIIDQHLGHHHPAHLVRALRRGPGAQGAARLDRRHGGPARPGQDTRQLTFRRRRVGPDTGKLTFRRRRVGGAPAFPVHYRDHRSPPAAQPGLADTAWMPPSCRWNDVNVAFMPYSPVRAVPE